MKEHTGKKHIGKQWLPFGRRALAVLMALLMVLTVFGSSGMKFQANGETESINLAKYLTDSSTMHITVYIDGVKHTYTPEELTQKGLTVPKGAPVKVELYFNTISKVEKGQTLVLQLPDNLMDYSGADANGYVWKDIVWEENTSGAEVEAADWVIDNTGKLTVTIRDDFFESNKHDDGTLDLFGFNIKFSGNLSSDRGEHSGNGDDVVTFRGETDGTGKISFTIPFEYLNENANAEVTKKLVSYDATTRTASYKITVTAPDTNTYTATNVVVKDAVQCDSTYIEPATKKGKDIYQNFVASTGASTFDNTTGTWTIGDMEPGQTETLTYDMVISKSAYSSGAINEIQNLATVTFNDDGKNQSAATLKLPGAVIEKEAVTNASGNLMSTDEGGTYVTYKLTVTANKGDTSNIVVKDAFDNSSLIEKIVVPDNGASTGNVTIDNDTASLTWKIDTLKSGKTATLTYKAYLNADKWKSSNETTIEVKNNATLSIDDGQTDSPAVIDSSSTSSKLKKTWVYKIGKMITDTGDTKHYDQLKYTLKVNADPVSANIISIYDVLTGGTYEDGGTLVIDRYTSSDKKTKVDSTNIALADIVTTTSTGQRWDINLKDRGLNGAYYYEITYYVVSTGIVVNNNAGIGFGDGTGYYATTKLEGSGGMSYGTSGGYYKSKGIENLNYSYKYPIGNDYKDGYSAWTVYVQQTIQKGSVYIDRLSEAYVWRYEQFWFDDNTLDGMVIKFDGKTLVAGEDYTVKGVRELSGYDSDAARTDPTSSRYNRFEITFNNEYAATKSNQLTIAYKVNICNTARDEDYLRSDNWYYDGGQVPQFYNYCMWQLPNNGNTITTEQIGVDGGCTVIRPLLKDDGTYSVDATTDKKTITWMLYVNNNTTVDGDATLIEYLPAGLTFVSAEITGRGKDQVAGKTTLGNITQGTYTDDDGNTAVMVKIPIKDLAGYTGISSGNVVEYYDTTNFGKINIKITTTVDDDWYMNLTSDAKLTNKAVLTDNPSLPTGGVTATGTATVPYTKLIDKSMAGHENPAYVEYALNINPSGSNLVSGDSLEVVDIMGTGMSLSTDHANSFKVYDVTNVSDLLNSSGNVDASKAQKGTDITSQCSIKNITGQELDGMTADEVGKPTYLITVPDGMHVVVVYWATFEGADGEDVTISNKASFFYNNALQTGGGDATSDKIAAADASSDLYVGAFFNLKKIDQLGKAVSGVTYTLYEVTVDSSGKETGRTTVMTTTTGSDGTAYFGHRSTDSNKELKKDKLYCLVETDAPTGYAIDSEPYYFEFKTKGQGTVDHPSGVTLHQFISGGTYSFTNQFTPASYSIPVAKTINGKTIDSDTKFTFTLKPKAVDNIYTDADYTKAITTAGITTEISGSGKTVFDTLYFTKEGTYTFTMTEDNLSDTAIANGYSKDANSFTVTIEVGEGDDNKMVVKSASFVSADSSVKGGDMSTSVPTFNNTLHLTGTLTLTATKEVTNRTKPVQAGEFAFTVSAGGEVIAETNEDGTTKIGADGKPVKKVFYTKAGGDIEINIDLDQNDIGTKTYIISEVAGDDDTIKYTTERVRYKVTIAEAGNGKVKATSCEPITDTVFTNEYKASGSITLEGTKILKRLDTGKATSVYKGEFNFVVKEGGTQVATGTNEANGSITFTNITYDASDIGVHTYIISEKDEGKLFVDYTDKTVKVQVTVTDAGDGKLATEVKYVDGTLDSNGHALFTNTYTLAVPSGIRLEFLPYILLVVVAGGIGILMLLRRRKHN
jgi:pilin isopeptide linkage protein